MANLCTSRVEIHGDPKDIADLSEKISRQDKSLLEKCPHLEYSKYDYGLWEDTFTPESESILFTLGSKWNFPFQDLDNLMDEYPELNIEILSGEPGMDYYKKIIGHDKSYETYDLDPIDYFSEINEEFAEEYNHIQNAPYDEFLKEYVDVSYYNNSLEYADYLLPLIIKRIKQEDLPLFIANEEITEHPEFIERIKT